eukprot:GHRR01020394.1.p1 GENE.GHRR01020394.1~~GHRR01020394.1.p1  ORF type:complete len:687 (+),score=270.03 GHRR01020394.1:161-2221(+)
MEAEDYEGSIEFEDVDGSEHLNEDPAVADTWSVPTQLIASSQSHLPAIQLAAAATSHSAAGTATSKPGQAVTDAELDEYLDDYEADATNESVSTGRLDSTPDAPISTNSYVDIQADKSGPITEAPTESLQEASNSNREIAGTAVAGDSCRASSHSTGSIDGVQHEHQLRNLHSIDDRQSGRRASSSSITQNRASIAGMQHEQQLSNKHSAVDYQAGGTTSSSSSTDQNHHASNGAYSAKAAQSAADQIVDVCRVNSDGYSAVDINTEGSVHGADITESLAKSQKPDAVVETINNAVCPSAARRSPQSGKGTDQAPGYKDNAYILEPTLASFSGYSSRKASTSAQPASAAPAPDELYAQEQQQEWQHAATEQVQQSTSWHEHQQDLQDLQQHQQQPQREQHELPLVLPVAQWEVADVCDWVNSFGLYQYRKKFLHHVIDGRLLLKLTDELLKTELGIGPLGHRMLLLEAVQAAKAADLALVADAAATGVPPEQWLASSSSSRSNGGRDMSIATAAAVLAAGSIAERAMQRRMGRAGSSEGMRQNGFAGLSASNNRTPDPGVIPAQRGHSYTGQSGHAVNKGYNTINGYQGSPGYRGDGNGLYHKGIGSGSPYEQPDGKYRPRSAPYSQNRSPSPRVRTLTASQGHETSRNRACAVLLCTSQQGWSCMLPVSEAWAGLTLNPMVLHAC